MLSSTDILLAELGLKPLQHVWLLRAAKFCNSLADKPAAQYREIALESCRAEESGVFKAQLGLVHVQVRSCNRL